MKSSVQATIFLFGLLVFVAKFSEGAITCSTVFSSMKPCIPYLQSGSGMPPPGCCSGAKGLLASAQTTPDKQAICGCLKTASKSFKMNSQVAQSLPKNCGFSLPYPISPNVDCSTIH